ncbi:MAG: hypothetical protein WBE13_08565 [Candidatus Acidiferrum sp.]
MTELDQLAVQIVRFVDKAFPGWVECEFEDAVGRRHTLLDKVPGFTDMMLDETSVYPQVGAVRCDILSHWKDSPGRELLRVSTASPDAIASTEDVTEFFVLSSQVSRA